MKLVTDITVVIPLYNKAPFIRRCLASVARQSMLPVEVIVVDDGSTDDGGARASEFQGLKVRVLRQDNAGVSAARNAGVVAAETPWIAFLDADDEYLPGALENLARCRERVTDAEVVFGRSLVATQGVLAPLPLDPEVAYERLLDYFSYLLEPFAYEIHSSSVMVRKDALIRAGLFPSGVSIGEDTDTWFRLGCLCVFGRCNVPISIYHISDGASGWEDSRSAVPLWQSTYETWRAAKRIPTA